MPRQRRTRAGIICLPIATDCVRQLLTNSEPRDNVEITLRVYLAQVIQQPSPTADHRQQATPRGVVLFVLPHVLGQVVNPCRQDGDLNFRRSGVRLVPFEFEDYFLFPLFGDRHALSCFPWP
jgi:hypothetical protein